VPPIVPALNESLAYTYCPTCRNNGSTTVMLTRELHLFKCPFGHQFQYADLQRFGAEMTPAGDVYREQPHPEAMKWPIFVMPRIKQRLEEKYPNRLMTTIATMLDLLADDAVIFIQGSEAIELRKRGLANGSQIIAALQSVAEIEKQRKDAIDQLEKLQRILRDAGVTE